jgi:hypothetical protein
MRCEAPRIVGTRAVQGRIVPEAPLAELARELEAGRIVILKGALDAAALRRARGEIVGWQAPDRGENQLGQARSSRHRYEFAPGAARSDVFESYLFAVDDPEDGIGPKLRGLFAPVAQLWRELTGGAYDFSPAADGRAVRPWAMYYPAGGGRFEWHEHPKAPQQVGLIAAMSEVGTDFRSGGTEFRTPSGVVDTSAAHDIGDLCLFRYDLPHRVTPVDPERERRWDGAGRWTLVIPVQ